MTTIYALLVATALLALAALRVVLVRRDERRTAADRERAELSTAILRLLHHVRNPVQSILLHADLLTQAAGPDDPGDEIRRAITSEAERLAGMLRELSAYASAPGPELAREAVPVRELLRDLARAGPAGAPPLRVDGAEDATVLGDPDQLRLALEKILANARDAVAESPDPRIAVRATTRGRLIAIEVRDSGDGIPADRLERVFEPFVSWKPGAMGLGLTTVRRIVERHGGRIEIESEPRAGTCVRILLPRSTPAPRPHDSQRHDGGAG